MSTPLTQLSNPQNTDENSEIVGEIINEMNNSDHQLQPNNSDNNNDLYTNSQNAQLERQMDIGTNIMSNDNLNNISNNIDNNIDNNMDTNSRPIMHLDTTAELSLKDRLFGTIKEPLVVASLYFLLSSPIINGTLSTYLPKLFSNTVSNSIRWVSLTVKSIVAGVLFYILKLFL